MIDECDVCHEPMLPDDPGQRTAESTICEACIRRTIERARSYRECRPRAGPADPNTENKVGTENGPWR